MGSIHAKPGPTMTLIIQLSPDTQQKLLERASQSGQTLEGYVQKLLEREAQGPLVNHLTPALREWLSRQVNAEETLADLKEIRDRGGLELQDFLSELEQVVTASEHTSR
jgi:hypothetical protein